MCVLKLLLILLYWWSGLEEEGEVLQATFHYTQALVDGYVVNLSDDVYVQVSLPLYIVQVCSLKSLGLNEWKCEPQFSNWLKCFQGEDGKHHYIAKIVEFFESSDNHAYFTAQWYYRAEDTVRL